MSLSLKTKTAKSQAGFTLVELAIVMIIIGLLIGGVLKGQELIANAQITSTVSSVKGIDAAMTTFRDTYAALPGDIANPGPRLPNCAAPPCSTAGNGDNRVATNLITAAMTAGENRNFWMHLSRADLLSGFNPTGAAAAWGGDYPAAPVTGGYHIAFNTLATLGSSTTARQGHYMILTSVAGAAPTGTALSAQQAARLDRKMDDGISNTGTVFTLEGGTPCGVAGVYQEGLAGRTCDLLFRIQN